MGVMGGPMAAHLARAGHSVVVWNRTPGKAELPVQAGAREARSLADLGASCEVVFLCVRRSEDVLEVVQALTPHLSPDALVVDHSTISPAVAEMIHKDRGCDGFLDAPITGGSMGAQSGTLTIFCGGSQAAFDRAYPALQAYAKRAALVGGPGAGQRMKLANQIAVAGSLLGLCEALNFARKAGLDLAQTRELLAGGAAGSWAFDHYGPKILAEDWTPGFTIANQRKDFGYCAETAQALDAAIPGTLLVDRLMGLLQERGQGELTTAALILALADLGFDR